jgi:hypothetical protein
MRASPALRKARAISPIVMRRQCAEYQAGFGRRITQIVQEQYATVRLSITVNQNTDIMVLGENNSTFGDCFSEQSLIARIGRSVA